MVPEGWLHTRLKKVASKIGSGVTPKGGSSSYKAKGIPLIRSQNVLWGKLDFSDIAYIDNAQHEKMRGSKVQQGDVLLNITGASIGRVAVYSYVSEANVNQHVCIIRPVKDVDPIFVREYLLSHAGQKQIDQFQAGGNRQGLNFEQIGSFNVALPPLPEQKKIAQILSTWDQAITATECLLENSQQRKKGLMQQLLTGKKRLPGFEGEWRKIELGAALDYQQPTPFLVKSTEYSDDFLIPVLTAGKTFLLGYTNEAFGIYDEGLPVIIFDDFTTASQFVDFPFKAKSSAMKILTAKPGYSIRFIFEAMRMIRYAVGGHQRHWISIFANLVIPCPKPEEQKAISEVFSTVDREIASLQARLDSLQNEKKALMQQLLTGKRRVNVETEAA